MTDSNDFTYRYAICRPDGKLLSRPKMSPMYGMIFGPLSETEDDARKPRTWDTREEAESALKKIRAEAAEMGIGEWLGVIVQQFCTPFTVNDPAEHFVEDIQQWLEGNRG